MCNEFLLDSSSSGACLNVLFNSLRCNPDYFDWLILFLTTIASSQLNIIKQIKGT